MFSPFSLQQTPQNKKFSTCTEGSWLGEIITSLLYALIQLGKLQGQPSTPEVVLVVCGGEGKGNFKAQHHTSVVQTSAAFWKWMRAIVRNGVDLPVALHFLNYTGSYPHGIFGALGMCATQQPTNLHACALNVR
jgi:hypothetical protein